jgi:outer membrane protein OmpA-like peptidoglycan-associated protein
VFGHGRFAPGQRDGLHLLAHELAHTIQQRVGSGSISPSAASIQVADPQGRDEFEADRAAAAVMGGKSAPQLQLGTLALVHRAACPSAPTRLGDAPVEPGRECEETAARVSGQRFLFCRDSDQLTDAAEAQLMALIPMLRLEDTVEVHGFASLEGPRGREAAYNLNLSCHRANRVAQLLEAGGVPPSRIHRYQHGGTSRFGAAPQNRAVVILLERIRDLRRIRFRVAALSFLGCVFCNPFTDDGPLALTPPTTEPPAGSSYRMKHWIEVAVATADRRHLHPSSPGLIGSGHSVGESGYCGRRTKAHVLSAVGPVGPIGSTDATHGEAWEWESEFVTQVGAVVPCTLPGAPCGPLGPNPMIPPIRNRFRLRVFADGTKESEFVSASTMPNHYLYEDSQLKMFAGAPVHPRLDFGAWATSTGVSLRESEIGFKALRQACCHGGMLPGCLCRCGSDGTTDVTSGLPFGVNPRDNFLACVGAAGALALMSCPTCAPAGSACTLPTWPSNP